MSRINKIFHKEITISKLNITVSVLLPLGIIATICLGIFAKYILVFTSMLLHELAHIIAAAISGKKIFSIKIYFTGLSAEIEELNNTIQNIIILSLGPLINLILFGIGFAAGIHWNKDDNMLDFFMLSNLFLFVFNVLPILPFDGGRLLREILSVRVGFFLANKYTIYVSRCMSILLVFAAIIQIALSKYNFSLALVILFIAFFAQKESIEVILLSIKKIICRKARFLKKGFYPVRSLAVKKSMKINDILKSMDFDRFHILYVLDDDLKLVSIITEQDLLDIALNYRLDSTMEEFLCRDCNTN